MRRNWKGQTSFESERLISCQLTAVGLISKCVAIRLVTHHHVDLAASMQKKSPAFYRVFSPHWVIQCPADDSWHLKPNSIGPFWRPLSLFRTVGPDSLIVS